MAVAARVRVIFRSIPIEYLAIALLFGLVVLPCSSQTAAPAAKPTVAEKIAASKDLLDINAATAAQLKALPGMGEAYAARVIAGRPYTAKNQLVQRGILPAGEYEAIKPLIIAHRPGKKQAEAQP